MYVDIIITICFLCSQIFFLCKDIDDDGVVEMHVKCNLNMVPSRFHILKIRIIQKKIILTIVQGGNTAITIKTLPLIDVNSCLSCTFCEQVFLVE